MPEQIVHLQSGILVPPEAASALAEWIKRLFHDDQLRARLAAGGRLRVRSEFTLGAQAEGLKRAYERAAASR